MAVEKTLLCGTQSMPTFPPPTKTPLLQMAKRVEFRGLLWEGEARRRKIIKWAQLEEQLGLVIH